MIKEIVVAIDPGLEGGIAALQGMTILAALDIPTTGEGPKRRVDVNLISRFLAKVQPQRAFIERAQAMPKQGASSGFNYGRAVGALEAAILCANVPLTIIEARTWKHAIGLHKSEKEESRQKAIQLFPKYSNLFERKKDHGRAEAALIAYYATQVLNNPASPA